MEQLIPKCPRETCPDFAEHYTCYTDAHRDCNVSFAYQMGIKPESPLEHMNEEQFREAREVI